MLAVHGLAPLGWPSKTPCSRALNVGVSFMQTPAIASDQIDATFAGKQCGDTFTPGETLTAEVVPGGSSQFMLELDGGGTCSHATTKPSTAYVSRRHALAALHQPHDPPTYPSFSLHRFSRNTNL